MRRPRAYKAGLEATAALNRELSGTRQTTAKRAKEIGLTEAHVQETVTSLLEWDGWRPIRTDPVSDRSRGKGFGELGMPDYLYVRYLRGDRIEFPQHGTAVLKEPAAEVLWIEFKAPGKAAKPHQLAWHEAERARGALVLVVDDIDSFFQWYAQSGLQRH
jgi:hypothetical protein